MGGDLEGGQISSFFCGGGGMVSLLEDQHVYCVEPWINLSFKTSAPGRETVGRIHKLNMTVFFRSSEQQGRNNL